MYSRDKTLDFRLPRWRFPPICRFNFPNRFHCELFARTYTKPTTTAELAWGYIDQLWIVPIKSLQYSLRRLPIAYFQLEYRATVRVLLAVQETLIHVAESSLNPVCSATHSINHVSWTLQQGVI